MKRLLSMILVLAMCMGLCACSADGYEYEDEEPSIVDIQNKIKSAVEFQAECEAYRYDARVTDVTYFFDDLGDGTYEVTGKVTVRDDYGDTYTGKYDAVAEWNAETQKASVESFELDKLYKD